MLHGLAAYDDDSDSNEDPRNGKKATVEKDVDQEPRRSVKQALQKPQVIIKRPQYKPRTAHVRAHISEELDSPRPSSSTDATTISQPEPSGAVQTASTFNSQLDELQRIRTLLRPPPIPGIPDWGIPPEPGPNECEPCEPAIEAKLLQFYHLKHPTVVSSSSTSASDQVPTPRHFNDSLMSNRSFRNPHLYTKLVEFVDVDERVTNFPKELWNPSQIVGGPNRWDAEKIAAYQKSRSEQAQVQSGKRTHIEFASSSHHNTTKEKKWERDKNKYNPYGAGAGYGGFGRGRVRLGK